MDEVFSREIIALRKYLKDTYGPLVMDVSITVNGGVITYDGRLPGDNNTFDKMLHFWITLEDARAGAWDEIEYDQ